MANSPPGCRGLASGSLKGLGNGCGGCPGREVAAGQHCCPGRGKHCTGSMGAASSSGKASCDTGERWCQYPVPLNGMCHPCAQRGASPIQRGGNGSRAPAPATPCVALVAELAPGMAPGGRRLDLGPSKEGGWCQSREPLWGPG